MDAISYTAARQNLAKTMALAEAKCHPTGEIFISGAPDVSLCIVLDSVEKKNNLCKR